MYSIFTKQNNINFLILLLAVYMLISCARPQTPTGGPKDETPPMLIDSSPLNQTLNYKGSSIVLEFDEHIQLKDIKNQLIITPNINDDYEYKYIKKKVSLNNLDLADSTTYTFNFSDGITDLTESNPAENMLLIFSTGYFLDSLSISGSVKNILQNNVYENTLLALYDVNDTLDAFTGRAQYSIKANKEGKFGFTNLKNGRYLLYAIEDNNNNYKCEPDKEAFGYYPQVIELNNNLDSIKLFTRHLNFLPFKINSARPSGKYFEIRFNKYITEHDINYVSDTINNVFRNLIDKNHTIRIYNDSLVADSVEINITAIDSIQQQIDTTLYINFPPSRRNSPDFTTTISKGKIDPNNIFTGELAFNKPILTSRFDSLYFRYDSTTIQHIDSIADINWNKLRTKLYITKQLDPTLFPIDTNTVISENQARIPGSNLIKSKLEKNTVSLILSANSFTSIENDTSIFLSEDYKFVSKESLATIEGTIQSSYQNLIIQLLDANNEMIEEIDNATNFQFDNLAPGNYKMRIIIDENNNNIWDPGSHLDLTPSENIFYLDKEINLRTNWTQVETIIIP